MKKGLLLLLFLLLTAGFCQAQRISRNAIGIRISDGDGFDKLDLEATYQIRVTGMNRIEADLGYRQVGDVDVYKGLGLFHWVFPINPAVHAYTGAGAGVEFAVPDSGDNETLPFVAADFGIEYDFQIPFSIALNVRPEYFPSDIADDHLNFDLGLAFRYEF